MAGDKMADWKEMAACKLWVETFSYVPTALLEKAYGPTFEDIRILAPTPEDYAELERDACYFDFDCEECGYECYYNNIPKIPAWATVFVPKEWIDAEWIKRHAKEIYEKTGFIVYDTDELGVYLGVNGAGYDFFDAHWIKLYRLRGLKWHETLPEEVLRRFK